MDEQTVAVPRQGPAAPDPLNAKTVAVPRGGVRGPDPIDDKTVVAARPRSAPTSASASAPPAKVGPGALSTSEIPSLGSTTAMRSVGGTSGAYRPRNAKKAEAFSLPPELAAKYEVVAVIGAGGMGSVLKARNRLLPDQMVAIKRPLVGAPAEMRAALAGRILAEGKGLAQLGGNANVARVVDLVEAGGELFLIMEFVEGKSLESWIDKDNPFDSEQLGALGVQAADALIAAHGLGILHRDIKPGNLMLTPRGRAVLVDFGLAEFSRRRGSPNPDEGLAGSLFYGAPEIWTGEPADPRSDVYSLAVTLYELGTGVNPFRKKFRNFEEAARWVIDFKPPQAVEVNKRLAPALSEVLAAAMSKSRDDRPTSAAEFLSRWEAALASLDLPIDELRTRPDGSGPECLHLAQLLARSGTAAPRPSRKPGAGAGVLPWVSAVGLSLVLSGAGYFVVRRSADNELAEARRSMASLETQLAEQRTAAEQAAGQAAAELQTLRQKVGESEGTVRAAGEEAGRQRKAAADAAAALRKVEAGLADARTELAAVKAARSAAESRIADLQARVTELQREAASRPRALPVSFPLDERAAKAAQETWAKSLGVPVELENSLGMKLALIPPGSYQMGSPPTENGRFEDEALHPVAITKPFYMGVLTVTNAQFRKFLPKHDSQSIEGVEEGRPKVFTLNDDGQPAVSLLHGEAVKFCQWLSEQPAEKAAGRVYRLPTEAEWEYACRAGSHSRFSWGAGIDPTKMNFADKNCADPKAIKDAALDDGYAATAPVGSYAPNAWGLRDMHGNVYQYCADRYGPYPAASLGPLADPFRAGEKGEPFVSRGGSWRSPPLTARCAARNRAEPRFLGEFTGFRVVCEVPAKTDDK
jgi:formylglycine-generating enzyme required for sulfatase activity/serine/threonine protein kinase